MINISNKLLLAKQRKEMWNEEKAFRLAQTLKNNHEYIALDWDGIESEDWISVLDKTNDGQNLALFIHAVIPLILSPIYWIEELEKLDDLCEIIEYSDFQKPCFIADKGILLDTFSSVRNFQDDGSEFSANSLYFYTV